MGMSPNVHVGHLHLIPKGRHPRLLSSKIRHFVAVHPQCNALFLLIKQQNILSDSYLRHFFMQVSSNEQVSRYVFSFIVATFTVSYLGLAHNYFLSHWYLYFGFRAHLGFPWIVTLHCPADDLVYSSHNQGKKDVVLARTLECWNQKNSGHL